MDIPRWVSNGCPDNRIITGDCLEGMKYLKDGSVDLVVTDPPYGISFQSNSRTSTPQFDRLKNDDSLEFLDPFVAECYRLLKPNTHMYVFTRYDVYPRFYDAIVQKFCVKNCLILWKKEYAMGDLDGSFATDYEMCIVAVKGKRTFNFVPIRRGGDGKFVHRFPAVIDFVHPVEDNQRMVHPTQKSVAICKFFIDLSSNKGDLVIDPFSGSGTTLLAAKQASRRYIGFEIDDRYGIIANNRLKQSILGDFHGNEL